MDYFWWYCRFFWRHRSLHCVSPRYPQGAGGTGPQVSVVMPKFVCMIFLSVFSVFRVTI